MKTDIRQNISIIVAIAGNNAIGKDNKLLWKLSEDLKRFKKITTGHSLIMGRNTFLSLPAGALPNRTNIVITDKTGEQFDNCIMVHSIEEAIQKTEKEKEAFVIGGGSIYKQFLPIASKLYLTRVHKDFEADTFFPEINLSQWTEIQNSFHQANEKNEYNHSFHLYQRI